MATTEEKNPVQRMESGEHESTVNQYSTESTEDNKPDVKGLEAEIKRLKAEIDIRNKDKNTFEALFDNKIFAVVILDSNYNFICVNDVYAKAFSRQVSDFPGHNHFEFYPSDVKVIFDQVVMTKESYKAWARPFVYTDHPEWGTTYWDWTLVPVLDSYGEVESLIFTLNDVTEHVRTKEKLCESEERYRSIFDNSIDGILLTVPDGTILSANPSACLMFGRTEEELCAVGRNGIVDMNDPGVIMAVQGREKTGCFNTEATLIRKDGTKFPGEATSNLFKDKDGRILSSIIVRDITERKKSEEVLRLSEEKFSKAFYHNQTMMAITRLDDDTYVDVNNIWANSISYKRAEMIGKTTKELGIRVEPIVRQKIKQILLEYGCIRNYEEKIIKKSGEACYFLTSIDILDINGEKFSLISAVDITERRKAEEALRESQELFAIAFDHAPYSLLITSLKEGKIKKANKVFLQKNGFTEEEVIGRSTVELNLWFNPGDGDRAEMLKKLNEEEVYNKELKLRNKDGRVFDVMFTGGKVNLDGEECLITIQNDITELKTYQYELERLDRLNLVGEMAAGIGHEVRNPMTTVKGFLQLLKEKERYDQDRDIMDLMVEELDRANSIISEFLSLAKNKAVELKSQSLNQKVRAVFPLLQADAMKQDKNIELVLGDIPHIKIDRNEVQQLILNLVRNGLDAMQPGGLMTIKTFQEDDMVVLAVTDQGSGIVPEVIAKIGTPFFTTKDNGTGLGLAVCYSIAARHNARIEIDTGPEGTTFFVRFKE
ncbi:PAS domain S-box protein [Pelotomaculum propionicicum]|uniref:PAS domain-containing protein n=1 Tax=Pelotomaculum propionicicum TaxID=258475 RepID=UPI003B770A4D